MKKLRKLLAMMLTVVMCVSTVSGTGFSVYAADDETGEAVSEETMTGDEQEDVPVDEPEDDTAAKLTIGGGEYNKTTADKFKEKGIIYSNGVLLLLDANNCKIAKGDMP